MYNKKTEEFVMYIIDEIDRMSLSKLLKNVSIEIHNTQIENLSKDIENRRKKLQEILEKLKIESILSNEHNKTRNRKTFPVYQLLFFRRLLLNTNEGDSMIKKICKDNFEEITEEEIKSFEKLISEDFNMWCSCYIKKYKLKVEDLNSFQETCESIEDEDDNEDDNEKEYNEKIRYYSESKKQMYLFVENFSSILWNRHKLDRINKGMLHNVKRRIEDIFHLETINNLKIDSLDRYKSIVGVIDVPSSLLYSEEKLLDEWKLFLLENFYEDFEKLLERWQKIIKDFPIEIERQRMDFVNEITDIKPTKEKALTIVKEKNMR